MGSSKFLDPTLLCLPLGCNFIFTFLNSKMVTPTLFSLLGKFLVHFVMLIRLLQSWLLMLSLDVHGRIKMNILLKPFLVIQTTSILHLHFALISDERIFMF